MKPPVCVCVCVCVCACARARVCARARACARVCACVFVTDVCVYIFVVYCIPIYIRVLSSTDE